MTKITKKQIISATAWLKRHGGSVVEVLKRYEKRITSLERSKRSKGQKYSPPKFCDAPYCKKEFKFQVGENELGKIGSWCSKEHFKQFAKN